MGYNYGDPRTAYNGICLWMQKIESVRKMDTNKKFNLIDSIIKKYLIERGIKIPTCGKNHLDVHKAARIVQKDFKSFIEFVRFNPQDQV